MTSFAVPDEQAITEAYIYLLGRMLVIRQEQIDAAAEGFGYNVVKYNPLGSADFVNPDFDVAYLEAWFAVDDDTAVLLEVPEVKNHYYTAQILDEWGEVIVNINERSAAVKPYGTFALTKPGSHPSLPDGATRIDLHSAKAKLLARVELKDDPETAARLQKEFSVTPLGQVAIGPPSAIPDFTNKALLGAEIFDHASMVLASALDVAPAAAEMQLRVRPVAAYVTSSPQARAAVGSLLRGKVVPEFQVYAFTRSAPYRDHWIGGGRTGNYGADYRLRTAINYAGIWANTNDEVIYFVATRDADENPLEGGGHYVIQFPADVPPDSVVGSYWSIILVGVPDYRVVPNDLNRYNFNTYSDLAREPDGSLKIAIGPSPVDGVAESNWMPSAEGKAFSLTFRAYVPTDVIKRGDWTPPAVRRVQSPRSVMR